MKNILVLGNGFISEHLEYKKSNYRLKPDENDILNFLDKEKPDCIINTIGRCGSPNVDQCELIKSETYTTNVVIPLMLARMCEKRNIHLIHLGSGCINYGPSPSNQKMSSNYNFDTGWVETDFSNPKSFYSKTKYACDLAIGSMPNVAILRLRMPVSYLNHPRNLINKLLKYKQVVETENSITFLPDLKKAVQWVIDNNKNGIYNVASPKPFTHSELLEEYKVYFPEHSYEKINEEQLGKLTVAARSNCILDVSKITKEGFEFLPAEDCMRDVIKRFVENVNKDGKIL